jgi:hypothetical protein
MDPQENIRRAKLIMDNIGEIAKRKQQMVDYFDQHQTLQGYSGPGLDTSTLTMLDLDSGATTPPADTGGTTPPADTGGGGGGGGAPVFDPKVDAEGDTGSDDAGNKWVVRNGKWVRA